MIESHNIFTSPYWHQEENLPKNNKTSSLSIRINTDENSVKLLNLEVSNVCGLKVAQLSGEPIIQYNELKNANAVNIANIRLQVRQQLVQNQIDLVVFRNVRENSKLYELINIDERKILHKKAPYIDLGILESLDDYYKTLSSSSRKSRRRAQKKLEKNFKVEFEVLLNNDISAALIDQVVAMKQTQLNEMGKTSRLFASQNQLLNLKKIILKDEKDFDCVFSILKLDGKIAAAEIGYLYHQTYYSFMGAMDNEYLAHSPGSCQLLKTIEWAIQNNVKIFDLLPPEDDYKFSWAKDNYINVYDYIFPLNSKGRIMGGLYFKRLRPLFKVMYLSIKKKLNTISPFFLIFNK